MSLNTGDPVLSPSYTCGYERCFAGVDPNSSQIMVSVDWELFVRASKKEGKRNDPLNLTCVPACLRLLACACLPACTLLYCIRTKRNVCGKFHWERNGTERTNRRPARQNASPLLSSLQAGRRHTSLTIPSDTRNSSLLLCHFKGFNFPSFEIHYSSRIRTSN